MADTQSLKMFSPQALDDGTLIIDIITVTPNQHGPGRDGYRCEFNPFFKSTRASGMTLAEFAAWHFDVGHLRKLGANRYAVIR